MKQGETFGQRLARAMEAQGRSQADIARAIGVRQPSVWDMLKRAEASKYVVQLAHTLQVRPEWLALGEGPMELPEMGGARVGVPYYDLRISAGPGAFVEGEAPGGQALMPRNLLRRVAEVDPAGLVFVTAAGDSMAPTIRDGEVLLVDTAAREVTRAGIYTIERRGEISVKRLEKLAGALHIRSDNHHYEGVELRGREADAVRVTGRVHAVWKAF